MKFYVTAMEAEIYLTEISGKNATTENFFNNFNQNLQEKIYDCV